MTQKKQIILKSDIKSCDKYKSDNESNESDSSDGSDKDGSYSDSYNKYIVLMTVKVTMGLVTEVLISTAIQQPQFGKKYKEGSSDKVRLVTLIYSQIALVG